MTEVKKDKIDNLDSEIAQFAESLPYWAKYLSSILRSGATISEADLDTAYAYVLEDAGLTPTTDKPAIVMSCENKLSDDYTKDLLLTSLHNIKGVNALVEDQRIEFCNQLTIIYGINGSGKTGYIRLLKKAFHSRSTEDILPNIHVTGHSNVSAEISFTSGSKTYSLAYPDHEQKKEFRQFSIFDNKCVNVHLTKKNQFVFRPAGLDFFADLVAGFKKVEEKITVDIAAKRTNKDYTSLFDGESDIKNMINTLSGKTKIIDLKKLLPLTEEEKNNRTKIEEQKAHLQTLKKDKEIADLNSYKTLLTNLKTSITDNNKLFTTESLAEVKTAISDCISKDITAKIDGIEKFKTEKIINIGSKEWKEFIVAAQAFAKQQASDNDMYPKDGDNCILCHQPLSTKEAQNLIKSYWVFIKSQAEQDAKDAHAALNTHKNIYEGLKFALLPEYGVLTKWMLEKHNKEVLEINDHLQNQKTLSESIIADIATKTENDRTTIQIDTTHIDTIINGIKDSITNLQENDPTADIKKLQDKITYLNHKEKLEQHITGIETYVANMKWAVTAETAKGKISKRKITDKEKEISGKYFNESYVNAFNEECKSLNCETGIDISHTGSDGTSYRQLFLKGKDPSKILSEGEQKIISLADFLAEMKLSEITCGVIFDDPVTSLDDARKSLIAKRIAEKAKKNQVIVFTHDLVFVSILISVCKEVMIDHSCHWIEKRGDTPGHVFLNNAPSYERQYRTSEIPNKNYVAAKKENCPPAKREHLIKSAFTELRTCYEVLVIHDLFKNVVQRFNERVSVDSLEKVCFDNELVDELRDNFGQCCRYMEGHTHSDKYAYQKPTLETLNTEICRYEAIRTKIKKSKKSRSD